MGLISDAAVSPGNLARRQTETEQELTQVRTARRAENTSIGAGGIRLHSGGGILVEDGGSITAEYPSGRAAAHFGPLTLQATGAANGYGLLVQADDDQARDIFRAKHSNSERLVFIGMDPGDDATGAVDQFIADAVQVGVHSHGDELRLQSHHGGDIKIYGGDSLTGSSDIVINAFESGTVQVTSTDGTAALGGGGGTFLQPEAGAGDAEVRMDSATGRITYSLIASTARVKRDIQDLDVDPDSVLRMRPRSWLPAPAVRQCPDWVHERHADESECCAGEQIESGEDEVRQVGFVAEELDKLGLGDFVGYDSEGLPSSIHYDRLTAALLPVLQSQQAQIDALTVRLDALETQGGSHG